MVFIIIDSVFIFVVYQVDLGVELVVVVEMVFQVEGVVYLRIRGIVDVNVCGWQIFCLFWFEVNYFVDVVVGCVVKQVVSFFENFNVFQYLGVYYLMWYYVCQVVYCYVIVIEFKFVDLIGFGEVVVVLYGLYVSVVIDDIGDSFCLLILNQF